MKIAKVINKCEDCSNSFVCKFADRYQKDQKVCASDDIIKGFTTVVTVECSQFSSKPKVRNYFPGDRQDG